MAAPRVGRTGVCSSDFKSLSMGERSIWDVVEWSVGIRTDIALRSALQCDGTEEYRQRPTGRPRIPKVVFSPKAAHR